MSLRSVTFAFSTCFNAGFSGSPNGWIRSDSHNGFKSSAWLGLKSFGERVAVSGSDYFAPVALETLPELVSKPLSGLLQAIASLTEQILGYDKSIEQAAERYPEVACITTVPCIGTLTALSFVLTVEDPSRIARSRLAGCFCGLRPKRSQSGERDPQLGISKTGDGYLRTLLVQCAHHLLGWRGQDCALRRWGLALIERGGSGAKKRAIVAVARKLAIVVHRLWTTKQRFEPFPIRAIGPAVCQAESQRV
jgi:transposase